MNRLPEVSKQELARRARVYVRVPVALRIIGGLLFLIAVGTFLLMLPVSGAHAPLTLRQALFTSVSALCVTGLSIITPSQDLSRFGQLVLLLEIQFGGVGFMFLVVLGLSLLRRQVSMVDRLAVRDSLGLPEGERYSPILKRVLLSVGIIEGVGALLLWLNWRGQMDDVSIAWYAIFHSISAFCNAGFDLFSGLPQFPQGIPHDAISLVVMGSIIVIGGLGFPVLAELVHWRPGKRLSMHTRLGLWAAFGLTIAGALGLLIAESLPGGSLTMQSIDYRIIKALFQSASTRTAGFALGDLSGLTPAGQFILIPLMFIGSGAASMGGGITTGTFVVLLISLWSFARGQRVPQYGRRTLPAQLMRRASAVLTVSLSVVVVATWLLLITGNGTLDQALFEVVSAFATTGLSLSFTSQLNSFGLGVVMLMMIWGRLGALTIIFALAQRHPPEPLQYPEESIMIG